MTNEPQPRAETIDVLEPRAEPAGAAKRARVLLVQTQAENAGAQEISRLVGAGLAARGYDVHNLFFFRQSRSFDEPPQTSYCAPRRPGDPLSFLRFLGVLHRRLRALRPDVILTFQHYGNAIGGGIARLAGPAPVIANQVSARLTMPAWLQAVDRVMGQLGIFRRITVNSHDMLRDYSRYPAGYRKRLTHVPHGFDQKRPTLSKAEARRHFGLPPDATLLGSVARLHPLKQLDAALRVLPLYPDWRLALAGQGPDEARLRQLAAELGVADRVHFVGEISPEQVANFLACLDVFVFPSLAETFGLAAVEAAHAGVPVVANDLPVLREVLAYQGEPAAVLVDASDPTALGAAIASVVGDPALGAQLRRAGDGLKTLYSVDAMVDEYVRIIEQAIGPGGPEPAQ
ncbi:glycosyltransferase family 4 protein [Rhodopseudomonas sp. HC1]|uniref:glycosyltransferase family 4 protein n=1 Tax=Rhodopseudomonas infernalis TaxID=2897386 RepID=UPI001EE7FB4F|nr:glycosyltransferase family 4 protein [Rhodopseudomonas infernalis]MCG6205622.1 glycosyltransferase family 4 protein [Rhodopseudomonas infernalis]